MRHRAKYRPGTGWVAQYRLLWLVWRDCWGVNVYGGAMRAQVACEQHERERWRWRAWRRLLELAAPGCPRWHPMRRPERGGES